MKKTLAFLLSAMVVLSCSVPAFAAPAQQTLQTQAAPETGNVLGANITTYESFLSEGGFTFGVTAGDGQAENEEAESVKPTVPVEEPAATEEGTPAVADAHSNKKYSGVEGYVERLYDYVLGRAASAPEISAYAESLRNGATAGEIASIFFNSYEFRKRGTSNEEYVTILYRAILNRAPSQAELNSGVSTLQSVSRNQLLASFVSSGEFASLCAGFGVEPGSVTVDEDDIHINDYSGAADFVRRLYEFFLNRTAADWEVEERVKELMTGVSNAAQMGYGFVNSPEFVGRNLSDENYAEILYRTMLDREPGQKEVADRAAQLQEGTSRNQMYSNFVHSPEFLSLCARYGVPTGEMPEEYTDDNVNIRRFVMRQYREVLGRSSDTVTDSEISWWADRLESGLSAAQFTADFFLSPEFKGRKLNDEDYVRTLYKALLNRDGSQSEVASYVDMLANQGASRNYLLSSFLASTEFKTLCSAYGLTVGSVVLPDVVAPNNGDDSVETNNFAGLENGIDVSMYQGSINWSAVKAAGYDFAIIRATTYTGGLQVDPYFYENVRGAKNAGIKVGAYVYTYSYSTSGVNNELNTLYGALAQMEREGYKLDYPVFWDVEANNYTNQASVADLTTLAKYAIDSMRAKGYYGALYTYTNFANTRLDMGRLSSYDLWIAQYGPRVTYGGRYTMWQYTSSGSVPGVSGNVDLNYSYKDYESEIKNGGWNHW